MIKESSKPRPSSTSQRNKHQRNKHKFKPIRKTELRQWVLQYQARSTRTTPPCKKTHDPIHIAALGYEKQLLCPVCLQLLAMPYLLPNCGHSFCFGCLDKLSQHRIEDCPVCRAPSQDQYPVRNRQAEVVLLEICRTLSADRQELYHSRLAQVEETVKERARGLGNWIMGKKIDIRVGLLWEVGTIVAFQGQQGDRVVEVQRNSDPSSLYSFREGSSHMASYSTFTREVQFDPNDLLAQIFFEEDLSLELGFVGHAAPTPLSSGVPLIEDDRIFRDQLFLDLDS